MLVIVGNIPAELRTADLRNFFSDFIEGDKFLCFHFRHRADILKSDACWCPVLLKEKFVDNFVMYYDGKNWLDSENELMISKVEIHLDTEKFFASRDLEGIG